MPREYKPQPDTLKGVSDGAAARYHRHKEHVKEAKQWQVDIGTAALAGVDANYYAFKDGPSKGESFTFRNARNLQSRVKDNIVEAHEHYTNHESEYHDIAVIDAFLDGVAINIERPLEIGRIAGTDKPGRE